MPKEAVKYLTGYLIAEKDGETLSWLGYALAKIEESSSRPEEKELAVSTAFKFLYNPEDWN